MEQKGQLKKRVAPRSENEIPDPPPEDNKGLRSRGSPVPVRMAMSVQQNEIPDPPPEDNKG